MAMLEGHVMTLVQEWAKSSKRHESDDKPAKIEADPSEEIMTLIWRMQIISGGEFQGSYIHLSPRHLIYNLAAVT